MDIDLTYIRCIYIYIYISEEGQENPLGHVGVIILTFDRIFGCSSLRDSRIPLCLEIPLEI